MPDEIKITKSWVKGLRDYVRAVKNTTGFDKESALNGLFGYLESLDLLTDNHN